MSNYIIANMRNSWLYLSAALSVASVSVAAPGTLRRDEDHGHRDHRVCPVKAEGNGKDDSQNILDAIHKCNNGGRVWFKSEEQYTIGKALDLSFMNNIDLGEWFRATLQI